MSREAMQMALDALEANLGNWAAKTKAVKALRQALKTEREWVGLTDEECIESVPVMPYEYEINVQALLEYTKIVEAKLKEKNA